MITLTACVSLCAGECVSYNDLNRLDWLFKGKGDIQFDVYRQMREVSKWVDKDCHHADCVDGDTVGKIECWSGLEMGLYARAVRTLAPRVPFIQF